MTEGMKGLWEERWFMLMFLITGITLSSKFIIAWSIVLIFFMLVVRLPLFKAGLATFAIYPMLFNMFRNYL